MRDNVIFWSGGKDSTATILLAHENNIPIKEIVFVEVMYDLKRNISGENPEHINWVYNVAIPKIKNMGYKVKILRAKEDYLDLFNHIIVRGERKGKRRGYLLGGMCKANSDLKMKPIREYRKNNKDILELVGIAIDEPIRLARLKDSQVSLLAKYRYTESMALELCKKYNLLSPTYAYSYRGGCWFCPNARLGKMCEFKKSHKELWQELVDLSNKPDLVSKNFKYGKTIQEIDKEIDLHNNQLTIDDFL